MDLMKAKRLNEFIVEKSCGNIEKSMNEKQWDKESFEVFSQALDNLRDIEKIEKLEREEEEEKNEYAISQEKADVTKVTTEFEQLIYDISKKHNTTKGMEAITTIIADHMEDVKIFNKRMYDMVMLKLKNMLY